MSGKAVRPTLSIGGYGIPAIPTQSVGGYSIPAIPTQSVGGYSILAIPTQSAAYMWLRGDGCGWRGVAAWVWQGCHTLLLIHLRRPMRMSASTDADVCADRCRCLRRPMRTSASTDADVCVERCEPCREGFLALASGKAERSTSFYHIISSTI